MASARSTAVQNVIGMWDFLSPPMFRMSWVIVVAIPGPACSRRFVHRVDHAPAPRKSSALKKACVIRWKIPAAYAPHADGDEHVAELGDRGVGEDLLDVVLLALRWWPRTGP